MGEPNNLDEGLIGVEQGVDDDYIASLLMPWSEYDLRGAERATEFWPEVFRSENGQQLTYFACQHTFDPAHPMFKGIDEEWQRFLAEAEPDSAVAIYEGRFSIGEDKQSTIQSGGESAYIRWLAKQAGVAEFWPEPTPWEEIAHLQQGFSDDQIVSFYCLRAAYQWHRLVGERPTIEEYLRPYMLRGGKMVKSSIHSVDDLIRVSPDVVGEKIFFDRRNSLGRLISPRGGQLPLNELARNLNQFRDVRIVQQIVDLWQQEQNLFMVYGNAHLIRQRRALEVLLKAKTG